MKARIASRCARTLGFGLVLSALWLAGCSHESADWQQAMLANSPEAYQAFLQQHPHSPEAVQARMRIKELTAQRDWQIASTADTSQAYQQFISAHPNSKWVQEARIRIENFAQAGVSGGAALARASSANSTPGPVAPPAPAAAPARPAAVATAASGARASSRPAVRHALAAAGSTHVRRHRFVHAPPAGRVVQLGAFRTKARAESEWRMLSRRFGELRSLTPRYIAARSRGARIYRLRVRLPSRAAAMGLCTTLKRHARPCLRINA